MLWKNRDTRREDRFEYSRDHPRAESHDRISRWVNEFNLKALNEHWYSLVNQFDDSEPAREIKTLDVESNSQLVASLLERIFAPIVENPMEGWRTYPFYDVTLKRALQRPLRF